MFADAGLLDMGTWDAGWSRQPNLPLPWSSFVFCAADFKLCDFDSTSEGKAFFDQQFILHCFATAVTRA